VETAKDVCFGVVVAWKARDGWKSKSMPLGRYITEAEAASFAISTALKDLPAIISRTEHRRAEIVTRSKLTLTEIQKAQPWARQAIIDVKRHAKRVEEEGGTFNRRLQGMIERLMDAMVDHENQRTLRDEAQVVFKESIDHIRARLGRAGFENEEIAARATKLLAEAEASKATAAKTRAEADEIALRTLARKLEMVLEADKAIARGEMEGFLKVLKELGRA
jgi:uncharacterized protein Smg (DUF494 family)